MHMRSIVSQCIHVDLLSSVHAHIYTIYALNSHISTHSNSPCSNRILWLKSEPTPTRGAVVVVVLAVYNIVSIDVYVRIRFDGRTLIWRNPRSISVVKGHNLARLKLVNRDLDLWIRTSPIPSALVEVRHHV